MVSNNVDDCATDNHTVGNLGTLTNLCIFFAFVDVGGGDPHLGACIAFAEAVTQNYILNEIWTCRRSEAPGLSRGRYGKFVLFSALALGVNALAMVFRELGARVEG